MLVLQPFLQPDLGIVMFKPGKTLLTELVKMSQGNRLVLMPLPDEMVTVPSGKLNKPILSSSDNQEDHLLDGCLIDFFLDEEVQRRLGGLKHWVELIPHCQLSDGEYCDKNLTTLSTDKGMVKCCWHHDNQERREPSSHAKQVAEKNVILWAEERISANLKLNRKPSLHELCWWTVLNGLYEKLPQVIVEKALGISQEQKADQYMVKMDRDDRLFFAAQQSLNSRVSAIELTVDDEPPAMFMARPKEKTWQSEKYLKFVRSLPCVITGKTTDVVAHHLIGHGEGKMAGKSHDLFTIPLHTDEHRKFHDDPKAWEAKHGSQLYYVKQTIKKALDLGALT
ncbi:DUF968 domain-containing protein [Vibrio tarriae]|uniref:DUF968 domain-containing protein n=1 Tax=Vibrio tarriae TaxID=2014742 RepID=UPI000DE21273|nr:DUF968 domain-containing protein [Vibrio tarriae]RBM30505.1 hypothetical protein DLR58_16725 [Vibrio tarriae]